MRAYLLSALIGATLLAISGAAQAHSFNVLLLLPLSGPDSEAGAQSRNGFMLATTERDSHPDQESDGHLGGLDVYVSTFDTESSPVAGPPTPADGGAFDVIAVLAGQEASDYPWLESLPGAKLYPRPTPFTQGSNSEPAVTAFTEAFQRQYGVTPSADAAQGYDAARRIDAAVREEGGVSNPAALQGRLDALEAEFAW